MVLTTFRAKDAQVAAQTGQLEALREARTKQLADYLGSIEEDLLAVADNPFTLSALRAYNEGWNALSSNQTQTLQKLYITGNPNPTGEKEKLDAASDGSKYSDAHATYHPWFRSFLYAREYYDIFLFNLEGDLIYSVFKELDYATNLNTGEWKERISEMLSGPHSAMAKRARSSFSISDPTRLATTHQRVLFRRPSSTRRA